MPPGFSQALTDEIRCGAEMNRAVATQCRTIPIKCEQLTSGRLFGYLARRPGNRATTARCPRGRAGMPALCGRACKWWVPDRGAAGKAKQ
jgi:hypothetical protein